MTIYLYKALDQAGNQITAELEADDSKHAISLIQKKGLFPTSLREKKSKTRPFLPPESAELPKRSGLFHRANLKQIIQFTHQFATMQNAGLSVLKSLQILHKQHPFGVFHHVLKEMISDIENGSTLTESMSRHPGVFDDLYVKIVHAGEAGGFLEKVLKQLAVTKERILDIRRKIIRASIYPLFVVLFAFGILQFLMMVVIPKSMDFLNEMGKSISGPLGSLISVSNWFSAGNPPGWLVTIFLPFALLGLLKLLQSSRTTKFVIDRFRLDIPILGKIYYKLAVARFSQIFGTLIQAGISTPDAIDLAKDTTHNEVLVRALEDVRDQLREGNPITTSFVRHKVFDPVMINMIEVGEETADLDKTMLKISEIYSEEAQTHIDYMMKMMEPTLIIIMCLLVGGLIVTLFMSVYS
jgi:type IV pilus assembly protein PilC